MAREWTDEEIKFIKDHKYMNDSEMSRALNIPRPTLNLFRTKIGYPSPFKGKTVMNGEMLKYAAKLYEEDDKSCREISEIIKAKYGKGVSTSQINYLLHKVGVIEDKPQKIEVSDRNLIDLFAFNLKLNNIKKNIKPGNDFRTREVISQGKVTKKSKRLTVKSVHPNFILTTGNECIKYDEIEGIYR